MPRPVSRKRVQFIPGTRVFVPTQEGEEIVLGFDELEALRLADMEGMYQEQAAREMNVSRATFGRLVEAARRKVATAHVQGTAIRVEEGNAEVICRSNSEPSSDQT